VQKAQLERGGAAEIDLRLAAKFGKMPPRIFQVRIN
jgi:hypothetical protein